MYPLQLGLSDPTRLSLINQALLTTFAESVARQGAVNRLLALEVPKTIGL